MGQHATDQGELMDRTQRAARIINMRKGRPLPHIRAAPIPESVHADLDTIDAATNDPAIHAATARIRTALADTTPRRKDQHMPEQDLTMQDIDPVDTWAELRAEQHRQDAEPEDAEQQD
jgi:hypothetical protein